MDLTAFGVQVTAERDAGLLTIYSLRLPSDQEEPALFALLKAMPDGSELSVIDPETGDGSLDVRRNKGAWETKRGRHGAYGTWKPASLDDAVVWLLPGALAASRFAKAGYYGATLRISNRH